MNPKILIIEDDHALAESLRTLCHQEGYEVVLTATAEAGLAQAASRPFDVVLTDLQLRESNQTGLQVIETLRGRDARLPVIMMTGHGTTAIAIEATKQGAFDYILKSGDQRFLLDLLGLLQSAIASRRRMHEQV